jgi:hypothetical protein
MVDLKNDVQADAGAEAIAYAQTMRRVFLVPTTF